jgi:hypothetical protein
MKFVLGLVMLLVSAQTFASFNMECKSNIGGNPTTIVLAEEHGWTLSINEMLVKNAEIPPDVATSEVATVRVVTKKSALNYEFSNIQKCLADGETRKPQGTLSVYYGEVMAENLVGVLSCSCTEY